MLVQNTQDTCAMQWPVGPLRPDQRVPYWLRVPIGGPFHPTLTEVRQILSKLESLPTRIESEPGIDELLLFWEIESWSLQLVIEESPLEVLERHRRFELSVRACFSREDFYIRPTYDYMRPPSGEVIERNDWQKNDADLHASFALKAAVTIFNVEPGLAAMPDGKFRQQTYEELRAHPVHLRLARASLTEYEGHVIRQMHSAQCPKPPPDPESGFDKKVDQHLRRGTLTSELWNRGCSGPDSPQSPNYRRFVLGFISDAPPPVVVSPSGRLIISQALDRPEWQADVETAYRRRLGDAAWTTFQDERMYAVGKGAKAQKRIEETAGRLDDWAHVHLRAIARADLRQIIVRPEMSAVNDESVRELLRQNNKLISDEPERAFYRREAHMVCLQPRAVPVGASQGEHALNICLVSTDQMRDRLDRSANYVHKNKNGQLKNALPPQYDSCQAG